VVRASLSGLAMTTATTWRKERGRETEKLLAAYWKPRGFPFAEATGAGRSGTDVTGMPGISVEVKATRACAPADWIRQAGRRPGLPFAVWRADGLGARHIDQWPVIIRLDEFTRLLRAAGYGDAEEEQ
jgi:hypothetical protein